MVTQVSTSHLGCSLAVLINLVLYPTVLISVSTSSVRQLSTTCFGFLAIVRDAYSLLAALPTHTTLRYNTYNWSYIISIT
jgi:hypothetical protein